jgi:hypothetical protein
VILTARLPTLSRVISNYTRQPNQKAIGWLSYCIRFSICRPLHCFNSSFGILCCAWHCLYHWSIPFHSTRERENSRLGRAQAKVIKQPLMITSNPPFTPLLWHTPSSASMTPWWDESLMYASDATELLALHEGRYWHGLRVFPPRSTARKQIRLRKRGKRTFQTLLMTSDNGFRGGLASLGQTDDINIVYRNERGSRKEAGPEGDASRSSA